MSAVALRCDADAERKLAHLRERFAEAFPVTGSADEGVGRRRRQGIADDGAGGERSMRSPRSHPWRPMAPSCSPRRRAGLEVAGNHVDHQGGRVISSAIGERTSGGWRPRTESAWCGWPWRVSAPMRSTWTMRIGGAPHGVETQSSAALLRGMLAAYDEAGGTLRGFDLATCSEVPAGCGLSSSAAFEVMVGAVLEGLFGPGPFAGAPAPAPGQVAAEGERDGFVPLESRGAWPWRA